MTGLLDLADVVNSGFGQGYQTSGFHVNSFIS